MGVLPIKGHHLVIIALNVVIPMCAKLAMVRDGKMVWEITMTIMEQASIKFLVEIVVMDIQKETVFAISVNKRII